MRHLETVLIAIYCLFFVVIYSYQLLIQITPKPIANSNKRLVLKQKAVESPTAPADGYQFSGGDGNEEIYSEESNKEENYEYIESTTTTTPAPLLKCKNNNLIQCGELTPK